MFRRDRVSKVVQSLKWHFEQYEQKQPVFSGNDLILPKLTKDISDVVTLLFGDEKIAPTNSHITALVPKLLDATDDLFYRLAKHRTAFDNLVQSQIANILVFLIKFGSKYGIGDYVLRKTVANGHNLLIDALLVEYRFEEQHTQAVFAIFQAMTKRKELASMLLNEGKCKVTRPVRNVKRRRRSAVALPSYHSSPHKPDASTHKTKTRRQSAQRVPAFDSTRITAANRLNGHGKHNTEPRACPTIAEIMTDDHKLEPTTTNDTQTQTQLQLQTTDVSFVDCLFELIKWPSLQVALHAFKTLRCLLVTDEETLDRAPHNRVIDAYFQSHTDELFARFNALIESDNALNKKNCFELLCEILRKPQNIESLLQYVTRPQNLVVARRILSDAFVESHTDAKQHNLIIELLLERYYEDAGEILQDLACRRSLADLWLNRTKITRLKEAQLQLQLFDSMRDLSHESVRECDREDMNGDGRESDALCTPCMRRSSRASHFIFHDAVNSETKSDGDIDEEHDLVLELLLLIKRSSSDAVADYAYHTLSALLTTNQAVAAHYLHHNYDALMTEIRAILQMENPSHELRRNQVLRLLSIVLQPTENAAFRQLFTSQASTRASNLRITMNLLKSKCTRTVVDALSIFYVFVSNAHLQSERDIHVILWRNTRERKLIGFIRQLLLHQNSEMEAMQTQKLKQKKADIIKCLSTLPKPHSDESCARLPFL